MRLSKIKLAGFKSFVDPTTITLPSNLVGVIGPNGCGKSNVIDAIRWVMGETSARHLRGDSMEDVIFNGSSARKPVGSASVELSFDNSDGTVGGQFASYAEISIRRIVTRDGNSQYFLNNTRCRRKDITGMFLGTGLGPRSYAIIEQGMVSRLVEARPEEMRTYIEEAAGISKYKERRRETETRISHTRDNLSRLNDLRDEIDKQIRHLQRQAQLAERYKRLKQDERQCESELLAMRLADIDRQVEAARAELLTRQTAMEAVLADQRQIEARIERARAQHVEATDACTRVQATYYNTQSEISRLEQQLLHTREMRDRQLQDRQANEQQLAVLADELARDESRLGDLDALLARSGSELDAARSAQEYSAGMLVEAERALNAWQEGWQSFNLEIREQQQICQVEQTRLEHLIAHQERLTRRIGEVDSERSTISLVDIRARLAAQQRIHDEASAGVDEAARRLESLAGQISSEREVEQSCGGEIESTLSELESRRGRLEALRAIQQTALGDDQAVISEWLATTGLDQHPRLVRELDVDPGWTKAVETVLGDFLQAILVDRRDDHMEGFPDATLVLLEKGQELAQVPAATLASRVRHAGRLGAMLASVHCADTLDEALRISRDLAAGASVITPDGVWLGRDWLRINRGMANSGVLAREQEIRTLMVDMTRRESEVATLNARRQAARSLLATLEQERTQALQQLSEAERQRHEVLALMQTLERDGIRAEQRLATLGTDRLQAENELGTLASTIEDARSRLQVAEQSLQGLGERRPGLQAEQEARLSAYNIWRERAEHDRGIVARLMIEQQGRRTERSAAGEALDRTAQQRRRLLEQQQALDERIAGAAEPLAGLQQALDLQLACQVEVQRELTARRTELEAVEAAIKADEHRRHALDRQVAAARDALEGLRVTAREHEVRRENLVERFAATGMVFEEVIGRLHTEGLADAPDVAAWEQRLGELRAKIERLGPINLAAIGEFAEQSERKTYLDQQHADLTAALETLEQAIRKIDRETRTRFQETFDQINAGLKRLFPRLFGGGHAYLGMEGEDLLAAGVTVMARPPGKRNSHIHLLSGGEKALTAVALIFSIFELNPAPFCLLDEVDAPLDEANVGRFCEIVSEMAKTVQFVVITHNKTTMEMTRQLMGVTMNEPGVSRLVAVDIDEAIKLAAS